MACACANPENSCGASVVCAVFIAGVGMFFEGAPEEVWLLPAAAPTAAAVAGAAALTLAPLAVPPQMYRSLFDVLLKLPPSTLVFPGHEYTLNNLLFAATVDGRNRYVHEKV